MLLLFEMLKQLMPKCGIIIIVSEKRRGPLVRPSGLWGASRDVESMDAKRVPLNGLCRVSSATATSKRVIPPQERGR